ncbi:MAG: response regulator [Candidatus Omnitrophica bacterium]|nr:response regulator [Candidatus Omnitrophota bacterium]
MSKPKILLCEDELNFRQLIKNFLTKNGYDVHLAVDGLEAIEKVKTLQTDIIILDIRMPKIDGIEVAKQIRKFDKKTKIIFLTAFQSPQLSQEAKKYNISAYITKPTSLEQILDTIKDSLAL